MIWDYIKKWYIRQKLNLMTMLWDFYMDKHKEDSEYRCLGCGYIPAKGSHCLCHGLYVTYEGHPYSSEGVRYVTRDSAEDFEARDHGC